MFILDTNRSKKAMIVYAIISVLCIVFDIIYEHFSYGENSLYMRLMFLFPLIGGVGVNALLYFKQRSFQRLQFLLYNSAIAILVSGCLVHGIIAISGRVATFDLYYGIASLIFLFLTIFI